MLEVKEKVIELWGHTLKFGIDPVEQRKVDLERASLSSIHRKVEALLNMHGIRELQDSISSFYSRCHNCRREVVEDAFQSVLTKWVESSEYFKFDPALASFKTYLSNAVKLELSNYLRSMERKHNRELKYAGIKLDYYRDPLSPILREYVSILKGENSPLSPREKSLLSLWLDGKAKDTICKILNISSDNYDHIAHRINRKVKYFLARQNEES